MKLSGDCHEQKTKFLSLSAMNYPNFSEGAYEDKYMKFKGRFMIKDLFDINNTQDIEKKLLTPILKQFREV